jgi:hypothetical protein
MLTTGSIPGLKMKAHGERHDEKGDRETEDRIAEALQAGHVAPAGWPPRAVRYYALRTGDCRRPDSDP